MTREQKEYRKRIDLEYPDRSKEALDLQKKIITLWKFGIENLL